MLSNFTPIKRCTACKNHLPLDRFHRNRSKPDGLATECKPCAIAKVNARYHADPEKGRQERRENYRNNSDAYKERSKKWHKENRARCNELNAAWCSKNPEKSREISRKDWSKNNVARLARKRQYRLETPDKQAALCRNYQARKLNAMPSWADLEEIESIYLKARKMTKSTGIKHHVDHVIPLRGKLVCGLHVHGNMQVLTAFENQSKGNKIAA